MLLRGRRVTAPPPRGGGVVVVAAAPRLRTGWRPWRRPGCQGRHWAACVVSLASGGFGGGAGGGTPVEKLAHCGGEGKKKRETPGRQPAPPPPPPPRAFGVWAHMRAALAPRGLVGARARERRLWRGRSPVIWKPGRALSGGRRWMMAIPAGLAPAGALCPLAVRIGPHLWPAPSVEAMVPCTQPMGAPQEASVPGLEARALVRRQANKGSSSRDARRGVSESAARQGRFLKFERGLGRQMAGHRRVMGAAGRCCMGEQRE